MNGTALQRGTANHRIAVRHHPLLAKKNLLFRGQAAFRGEAVMPVFAPENQRGVGVTQACGGVDDRVQHRLEFKCRPAHDFEQIGRGDHRLVVALGVGDVAGGADHAQSAAIGAAHRDAGLPRPAPVAGAVPVAQFHREARRVAFEMFGQRVLEQRPVVRMNAISPVLRRPHLPGRNTENLVEARREVDGIVDDIPVVEVLVDGFERERVALRRDHLGLRRLQFTVALLDFSDVAGGADHAADAALGVIFGDAVLARPAPASIGGAITKLGFKALGFAPE